MRPPRPGSARLPESGPRSGSPPPGSPRLRAALAAATDDRIVYDLPGIEQGHDALLRELPGVRIRFALKACPVDDVLAALARRGAGFDAAGPEEIAQALRTGVPASRVHYGNTVKSDAQIAAAHRLGIRDYATDSLQDLAAIARHAPGSRVFCRLAAPGGGALWGLGRKFGCAPADAVALLLAAQEAGLTPAGLSVHVGSQQMTADAWRDAFDVLAGVLAEAHRHGIAPDHVNLGGGLPARGYRDRRGNPLEPPLDKTFATLREGMRHLAGISAAPLDFVLEPGRHLVADHGAVRAHVVRLTERTRPGGGPDHWLYVSCGRFNGLYEMDAVQYPLEFPSHPAAAPRVPAVVAGPTCDSDDAYDPRAPVPVPAAAASGDPVWIHAAGAYAVSYTTRGFNGFAPLPCTVVRDADAPPSTRPED
ncbi:type III PLP-dependent enzyme [Streptomyces sp. NPDC001674]|uniref:type III PLP-dependent enzyme n=1 Tax=Streptomyces sp. NPDC001674 TaxID=3154394 RepID=UPI00332B596A